MSFDLKISNGDLSITSGDLSIVVDTAKLTQDILKICLTSIGADPANPWYGSYLSRTMIGTPNTSPMLAQIAQNQLTTAITNLKSLQGLQVKAFQRISAAEQLASITNISVLNTTDPRLFNINIQVISKGLTPLSVNFQLSTI